MKPVLTTEIIEIRYWKCGVPEHRHKKERFAISCIEKQQEKSLQTKSRKPARTNDDLLNMLRDHLSGISIADLSEKLQITKERTRQLLARAKRIEQQYLQSLHDRNTRFFSLLPTQTANALRNEGFKSAQAVGLALKDGMLDAIPNIGKKGREQIAKALVSITP